ncbi:MFS transporter [Paenarthrobacter sp. NPDC090520]|uniref:MFS transporter n=1 Tax=Paenarthrobacter sp. NPDC090520 TaxID=3364382 RepID=UPI0038033963
MDRFDSGRRAYRHFVGAPIGGWATDKFGRKTMFLIDMALFVIASALQFFVDTAEHLFIIRLLMGIAIGIEYSVGFPLMAEFSPIRLRGRLMALVMVAWYVGFMVAFVVGHILATTTDLNWRLILGTSTAIAVILFVARIGLPESPHWLWNQGRQEEALTIARRYMESAAEMEDVRHEEVRKGSFGMLFSRQYWRSTLFTSGFWFCAVTPYFAIATFADSVLAQFGAGGFAGGIGLSMLAVAGVVLALLLIDKAGRRILTVPPQWICGVILAAIGLWVGAPPVAILALFLAFSFFTTIYGTMTSIYPGEIFPTEIRGLGTGFAAAVSRIGAALGTFLLPWSMTNLGTTTSMLIAAAIAFAGAALSQWLAPETKGKSLTETAGAISH